MNEKQLQAFVTWLQNNECEILKPTSQWEKLRYRHPKSGVCIIHVNKNGVYNIPATVTNHIKEASGQGEPTAAPKKSRPKVKRRTGTAKRPLVKRVHSRDGDHCCFCDAPATPERPLTIEHWLSISKGGTNDDANIGLAHEVCNILAGNMAVSEKMKLRDRLRACEANSFDFSNGFYFMGEAA
jgi:hypothetical protein